MSRKRSVDEDYAMDWEDNDDEIELMDLLFILVRRWKLITIVAVPVLALGIVYALLKPAMYKAETTLMVSSGQIYSVEKLDNSEISKNQKLVSSYTEVARSKSIMKNVIKRLGLEEGPETIAKLVKVSPIEDTEFIKISYMDRNARKATLMVNEVSKEFMLKIRDLMNFENLKIVEQAEIPTKPESRKRALIVAVSGVLGIMLGVFAAFLMEFIHSNVKKPEDLQKIMGCKIIANVPDFEKIEAEVKK
ncbi:Wzz/FepE/Etk N-terminal domain-containing protein [uncultured Ilyobacter sp.]|uniref:YveK family protein n=1 Tax=uncultured Ilyobacter sp. TaxID=544433 RepID=UPI0029C70D7C|nr:Wzz/FepE/Etk N-terminal domain-containing protein [uncultured Ilyobacter sp.]